MAKFYKSPGVYIQNVGRFPSSIAQVETAIPGFIGRTQWLNGVEAFQPQKITSILDYEQYFGTSVPQDFNIKVRVEKQSGNISNVDVAMVGGAPVHADLVPKNPMYYAMRLFFDNGGVFCYVVSTGTQTEEGQVNRSDIKKAVEILEHLDEVTLIASPDASRLSASDYKSYFSDPVLKQCLKLHDRFGVFDVVGAHSKASAQTDILSFRTQTSNITEELKLGAAYFPYLQTGIRILTEDAKISVEEHKEINDGGTAVDSVLQGKRLNNAVFDDHKPVYKAIKNFLDTFCAVMPPSPAIVGVYAKVDGMHGVWKAPANVSLSSVVAPVFSIDNQMTEGLNVDLLSGKSINAIRQFPGKGILVWGARTLAGNDNEWRYISVRRFFNMVEESVKKGTRQFVFEPNDANTWTKIKALIENFLVEQWRAGALAGSKPSHAFFVKVGLGETMTASDMLNNKMIIEIGMAVVRPAEFIIMRFTHKMHKN
ncbi:phage tail sheath family protein [Tamlana crocina]|uniref:Phage tail sheath family protein n=1 Tax=Tamlana crocina TaxID=393006 RepID=A0ABX1DDU9_9FLAO|nr:phage tail sheath family protein [Tamlana crocina]NJX16525.1 phage tail sheath family protein [Tamlana crocina]